VKALIVLVALAGTAAAGRHATVVVMAEPELGAALQVAMSGRGVAIASAEAPGGDVLLARAAAAQHAALDFGATASLWVEERELYLVTADGRLYRHVPLTSPSARVFAAIASGLIDEMMMPGIVAPAPEAIAPPAPVGRPATAAIAPPAPRVALADGIAAPAPPAPITDPADHTLLEVGAMVSPIHAAVEAELAWPVAGVARLGLMVGGGATFNGYALADVGAEIRTLGHGRSHFDLGAVAGIALTNFKNSTITYVGPRLGYTWGSISASLVPMYGWADDSPGDHGPGLFATIRWEHAL